jgi:hypothetical protein
LYVTRSKENLHSSRRIRFMSLVVFLLVVLQHVHILEWQVLREERLFMSRSIPMLTSQLMVEIFERSDLVRLQSTPPMMKIPVELLQVAQLEEESPSRPLPRDLLVELPLPVDQQKVLLPQLDPPLQEEAHPKQQLQRVPEDLPLELPREVLQKLLLVWSYRE